MLRKQSLSLSKLFQRHFVLTEIPPLTATDHWPLLSLVFYQRKLSFCFYTAAMIMLSLTGRSQNGCHICHLNEHHFLSRVFLSLCCRKGQFVKAQRRPTSAMFSVQRAVCDSLRNRNGCLFDSGHLRLRLSIFTLSPFITKQKASEVNLKNILANLKLSRFLCK